MLVHRAHVTGARGRRALELGTAIDETVDRPLERTFVGGPIDYSGSRYVLVASRSAMRHDQRNSARACLRGNHAKGFGLAAMNQGIGARQETRKIVPIAEFGKDCSCGNSFREQLQLLPFHS